MDLKVFAMRDSWVIWRCVFEMSVGMVRSCWAGFSSKVGCQYTWRFGQLVLGASTTTLREREEQSCWQDSIEIILSLTADNLPNQSWAQINENAVSTFLSKTPLKKYWKRACRQWLVRIEIPYLPIWSQHELQLAKKDSANFWALVFNGKSRSQLWRGERRLGSTTSHHILLISTKNHTHVSTP